MAGRPENLLRPEDLTAEERQERARKAGKASAEARRRKKTMRQLAKAMLEAQPPAEIYNRLVAMCGEELEAENITWASAMLMGLIQRAALKGDPQAALAVCRIAGISIDTPLTEKHQKTALKKLEAEATAAQAKAGTGKDAGGGVVLMPEAEVLPEPAEEGGE